MLAPFKTLIVLAKSSAKVALERQFHSMVNRRMVERPGTLSAHKVKHANLQWSLLGKAIEWLRLRRTEVLRDPDRTVLKYTMKGPPPRRQCSLCQSHQSWLMIHSSRKSKDGPRAALLIRETIQCYLHSSISQNNSTSQRHNLAPKKTKSTLNKTVTHRTALTKLPLQSPKRSFRLDSLELMTLTMLLRKSCRWCKL